MNSPANPSSPGDPPVSADGKQPPEQTDSDLWTSERVAQYLHVSLKTVFNLRKHGLPFVKLGGAVRFVPEEVKDHLDINRGLDRHRLRQLARKGNAT
jgi:excisionase family DNA binding protein